MNRSSAVAVIAAVLAVVGWLWLFHSRAQSDRERALWKRYVKLDADLAESPGLREQLATARTDLTEGRPESASEKLARLERQMEGRRMQPRSEEDQSPPPGGGAGPRERASPPAETPERPQSKGGGQANAGGARQGQRQREALMALASSLPPETRERVARETMAASAQVRQLPEGELRQETEQALQSLIRQMAEGKLTTEAYSKRLQELGQQVQAKLKIPAAQQGKPAAGHPTDDRRGKGSHNAIPRRRESVSPTVPPLPPAALAALSERFGVGGGKRDDPDLRLENDRLVVTLNRRTAGLTVSDRVTQRLWGTVEGDGLALSGGGKEDGALTGRLCGDFPTQLRVSLGENPADLVIELTPLSVLSPGEETRPRLRYPPPVQTNAGGNFALPREDAPTFVPAGSGMGAWLHVGRDLTANWYGYGDRRGGYVALLALPEGWEAALQVAPRGAGVRTICPVWAGSPPALGQPLRIVFRFTAESTFVGLARMAEGLKDAGS